MSKLKILSSVAVLGAASVFAVTGLYLPSVQAQNNADTNASLTVTAGTLNMYAGDATDNNDLCIGTNGGASFIQDNGSTTTVTCTTAESAVAFSGLNVNSVRQSTTVATINDILFEDLSGSTNNTYAVAVTIGNLINGTNTGSDILLGSNPDVATVETTADANAPTGGDAGKLYCVFDPSVGTTKGITPGSADLATLTKGVKTTVIATNTSVAVFGSNGADIDPGRYDLDGASHYCRVPAYVTTGTYSQALSFTVSAL